MPYRYLPDSPRWLLRHGRIEETRQILIEGGNKNKRRIPINLEDLLKSDFNTGYVCMKKFSFYYKSYRKLPIDPTLFYSAANQPQASWCTIWDGKPPKVYILAVHYAWSVYVLNFNCVVLNIRAYGHDHLSINTVAIGFSEILGVFVGIYIVLYTSRRWLWAGISGIASGCLVVITWFIPQACKQTGLISKANVKFN